MSAIGRFRCKSRPEVNNHKTTRMRSEALLAGRMFDDRGNRMTPSHVRKRGIKYRYYLSSTPAPGPRATLRIDTPGPGNRHRDPGHEIGSGTISSHRSRLTTGASSPTTWARRGCPSTLHVPWHKTPATRRREILLPASVPPQQARPIRSETRATLIASIVRGRRWLNELVDDAKANVESIAKRERCSVRQVNMTISLFGMVHHRSADQDFHRTRGSDQERDRRGLCQQDAFRR